MYYLLTYLLTYLPNLIGVAALGEKLGLDVESDLRILVLLWKAQAQKPGTLTKNEWTAACKAGTLNVEKKWESVLEQLPALDIGFLTGSEFKDFYKFCFQFNRQGTHRTLDKDLVVALLQLVLKDRVTQDRLESFCEFLTAMAGTPKEQQYSRITLDQWTSFWDFCVECEDLSNYDECTSAWPVLIDEYVDYMELQMSKNPLK
jgi:hypothetical protein